MSNKKTIVCIYTEGATDFVFYNKVLDYFRNHALDKRFCVELKKENIEGIGRFQNKLLNKFKREVAEVSKYKDYKKIVVLCYDNDVFALVNQTPPIDREKLKKDLIQAGASQVIPIVAYHSIEDVFLIDLENILKSLKLKPEDARNLTGSGYDKLKKIYKKTNKMYVKGDKVEEFVEFLNIEKICKKCCPMFSPLCKILTSSSNCDKRT